MRGEELDDLVLDQRRVDVEHDEPLRPAVEPRRLDGDVEAARRGVDDQGLAEPVGVVGSGQIELDAGDGVARQPGDPVDVGAAAGDAGGDGGDRPRPEPVAEHRHVGRPY